MRRRNEKEPRNCEWCGKSFIPKYGRRYCSPECSQAAEKKYHREYNIEYYTTVKARRAERRAERERLKPKKPVKMARPRKCPVCQTEFFTKDYRKTFCSPECRKKDHQRKMRDAYRIRKAKLMAKEHPAIRKPVQRFIASAPRAIPRMDAMRLPMPYIKRGAVKCV
jgi:endogenous inhibitor of DNA gyrase (YacG/DUF329 family)